MKQQQSIMLPTVSYRRLFQGWFCSHFNFHLFMLFVHCILCISCICFVFVSYALTLSMSGREFYVNKDMFCSVNKDFCHLLITFANSKDPDQGREECWSLSWSKPTDTLIVYSWKNLLKKVILKKKSADDKKFIEKRSFWFYCIVFEFKVQLAFYIVEQWPMSLQKCVERPLLLCITFYQTDNVVCW